MSRKSYPSDVSDEEWAFVAPYPTLMTTDAPQRHHDLREIFNAMRWLVCTGSPWRYLPHDFPRWDVVYQQTQRWITAGCFEAMVHYLRLALRVLNERKPTPSAAIYDSSTLASTPESGARAGYNGHKKTKGSKVHIAVDTLGHLLALKVTPANEDDRSQVAALSEELQDATGQSVDIAYVDQGYTGENTAEQAQKYGIELIVVKLQEAKKGFVLLLRRWVVERSFAWATRFRRLAKDYERLPETVEGLHYLALAGLMLKACFELLKYHSGKSTVSEAINILVNAIYSSVYSGPCAAGPANQASSNPILDSTVTFKRYKSS